MSVATLNEHTKVVETSDELESFFHVVLYYGVRYLVSNCADVGSFIKRFFDSYIVEDNEYLCGKTKRTSMFLGELKLDNPTTKGLVFSSPMDMFFSHLLQLFKAHYTVANYDKAQLEPEQAPPTLRPVVPLPQIRSSIFKWVEDQASPVVLRMSDSSESPPDLAQRALASLVQDHQCMLQALSAAMKLQWPPGDRVMGDNVELQKLKPPPAAASIQPTGSNKRRCTGKTPVATPILSINSEPLP